MNDRVQFVVSDSGNGISSNELGRAFELFSRVGVVNDTRPPGLGIGLWIVRRIVELHDGTIELYSAGAGRGTRVTITLPRMISG